MRMRRGEPGEGRSPVQSTGQSVLLRALSLLAMLLPAALLAQQTSTDPLVGRAGSQFITEREFLERFELTPGLYRHRPSQLEGEKLKTLYSIIAEKLLSQEALERHLDRDSVFQGALLEVTRLIARDELYRQEIRRKVTISSRELDEGMKQARTEVRLRFLFSPDSATAVFLRRQIKNSLDFDRLLPDSSMQVLRDTATIVWGDADTAIQRTAYRLKAGEVSRPIKAGEGWYILRVTTVSPNPAYADLSPLALRERVSAVIRMRKERSREVEFLREFLKTRVAFSPPSLYRRFADSVATIFRQHYVRPSTSLSPAMAAELRRRCSSFLTDTLIVAGTVAWSVDQAIDRLLLRGFTVSGDTVRGVAQRLYDVFQEIIHQELLAEEALGRGLDRVPEVQKRIEPWRDHYLSGIVRRKLNSTLSVSDAEVYAYLRSESSLTPIPEVQLRELRTGTIDEMQQAVVLLEKGMPFSEVVARLSSDPELRLRGGLTPFFPVTARQPLGAIASQLDSGQVYGPFRDSTGFVMVQLAANRNAPDRGDTAFASRFEAGRLVVQRMKQQRVLTLFLAQSARARGFDVFADRLKALQVTTTPMLAYRLLGFGGRMFEVPFVEPQLEWLETDPPSQTILP